ncbi:MAG: hypothetical protein M1128_00185 [Candidatus Marsarchaeota archaeon]|nr:hypothetical protein [Candidatus Marsarchaeota archaeon]
MAGSLTQRRYGYPKAVVNIDYSELDRTAYDTLKPQTFEEYTKLALKNAHCVSYPYTNEHAHDGQFSKIENKSKFTFIVGGGMALNLISELLPKNHFESLTGIDVSYAQLLNFKHLCALQRKAGENNLKVFLRRNVELSKTVANATYINLDDVVIDGSIFGLEGAISIEPQKWRALSKFLIPTLKFDDIPIMNLYAKDVYGYLTEVTKENAPDLIYFSNVFHWMDSNSVKEIISLIMKDSKFVEGTTLIFDRQIATRNGTAIAVKKGSSFAYL